MNPDQQYLSKKTTRIPGLNNPDHQHSAHTPFIIVLIVLLAITGVQFFFNFHGLTDEAAMDQAQIARNFARGDGMVTNVARPFQLMNDSIKSGLNPLQSDEAISQKETLLAQEGRSLINPDKFDPYALKNTRYAPLNILVESVVFKLAGVDRYELWKMDGDSMIYLPDRIVAGISCAFFILAVLSCYFVLMKMFDTTIAGFTCLMIILSDLFLKYAISGLPQMLMLFFFVWGAYFIFSAMKKEQEGYDFRTYLLPLILSAICFSCVCLTGWIGLWPMAGFLIFLGIRFKPYGLYALPCLIVLGLLIATPVIINKMVSGSVFGTSFNTICTGLIGDSEATLRVLAFGDIPLNGSIKGIINNVIAQLDVLYENMGKLPLALIFLLSLLHTFKRKAVNQFKWTVFTMWVLATIGMSLYTPNKSDINVGQIQILFSPFFTAFGTAFVLNLIAKHSKGVAPVLKGCVLIFCLLVTSLPLILSLPDVVRVGILTSHRGIPAWPPYYPLGITKDIRDQTKPEDFILTDQPAAIAWYADRKAINFPKQVSQFEVLERLLSFHNRKVGSILVSPKSTSKADLTQVQATYGDFAPLVLEGSILLQSKDKDPVYLFNHSSALTPLLDRFGANDSRQFILGAGLILYKDAKNDNSTPLAN